MKVLIVEDTLNLRITLERELGNALKCTIETAANEKDAINRIRNDDFSLVISDLNLSEQGGGFKVIKEVLRCQSATPVIAITSYANAEYRSQAEDLDAAGFVARGSDESAYCAKLQETVSNALEEKIDRRRIRILHLSDLHFTADTAVDARLEKLVADIRGGDCMGFDRLDYICVSGDFTNCGCPKGLEKAHEFIRSLMKEFSLTEQHCILVPGNHDVVDFPGAWIKVDGADGQPVTIRSEDYKLRFKPFSEELYEKLFKQAYPFDWIAQGMAIPFWETGLQFVALNSCWEVDQYDRNRAGVNDEAMSKALSQAGKQVRSARENGEIPADKPVLRIAVLHHAAEGAEQMRYAPQLLGNLQQNGVRLCLHGDVHELWRSQYRPWGQDPPLYIAGAGSFGALPGALPEATPRMYNLLEIKHNLKSARVHTRRQMTLRSRWEGLYEWPDPRGGDAKLPYYDILPLRPLMNVPSDDT